MKLFGITGGSGHDKIALLVAVVPELTALGLSVSVTKFMNHAFDIDRPGKDSFIHREAGATEVLVLSRHRWALMHENQHDRADDLPGQLARMSPVDLVIALGFHDHPHTKIEIVDKDVTTLRWQTDPTIVGIVSRTPLDDTVLPAPGPACLAFDDAPGIAGLIAERADPVDL
jgi:molybdopterin-guanine dinucleotide biosynthesis protein B